MVEFYIFFVIQRREVKRSYVGNAHNDISPWALMCRSTDVILVCSLTKKHSNAKSGTVCAVFC